MTLFQIPIVHNADYFDFVELIGTYVEDPRVMLRVTNSVVDKANEVVAREVDNALDVAESPFRRIMDEQEQELQTVYGQLHVLEGHRNDVHEILVNVARQDDDILSLLRGEPMFRRKIDAIKRLRALTGAGLKGAKDAIEDPRVPDAANPMFEVVGVAFIGNDEDYACQD